MAWKDMCCQVQLLADAAAAGRGGETVKVNDEEAAYTHKTVGNSLAGWFQGKPQFDMISMYPRVSVTGSSRLIRCSERRRRRDTIMMLTVVQKPV